MNPDITLQQARKLKSSLMNAPVAPGGMAPVINVGTDAILNVLEEHYFLRDLADGISCFKYLEGDYGSGKTQFIQCLAKRAHRQNIATSIVNIGQECPFSSPLAILQNVMGAFVPPDIDEHVFEGKGIEALFQSYIRSELRKFGITQGDAVPETVQRQIERPFTSPWIGAPDTQMANALSGLGRVLTGIECGASMAVADQELMQWVRGDAVRSNNLKQRYGLYEPARDETAFRRLKTVINFLRERLNYRGFLIAFDEGTRVNAFRRGTARQRQAIENMLTMINHNAEGDFGGVMFLYAATPDFRADVIQTYIALRDRIGSVAFTPGRPMTPLINLDDQNSDETLRELGSRLLHVFSLSDGVTWDPELQNANMIALIEGQKRQLGYPRSVPPRYFVFYWCRFLEEQLRKQGRITLEDAIRFVQSNILPEYEAADAARA
jgi:hypothetical protein